VGLLTPQLLRCVVGRHKPRTCARDPAAQSPRPCEIKRRARHGQADRLSMEAFFRIKRGLYASSPRSTICTGCEQTARDAVPYLHPLRFDNRLPYFSSLANSLISRFQRPVHEAAEWQAAMDHSLESRTLNPSISANAIAYDFCAPRVGRCVKRKLRPKSGDPSLLSPTSAIPHPCSEGGSMTIAKGGVSIFTFLRFLGFGRRSTKRGIAPADAELESWQPGVSE
jgi:hypothetical protein